MNSQPSRYMSFSDFRDSLSAEDNERLSSLNLVFCYPTLQANTFEMEEPPISQRILMAVFDVLGAKVVETPAIMTPGASEFVPSEDIEHASAVVIHPMISCLPVLPAIVAGFRGKFPNARIILQNSDQHQHEKLVGGPGGMLIARRLLEELSDVDAVITGFAEHTLVNLMLGRKTDAAVVRSTQWSQPARFFDFGSLPNPGDLVGAAGASRSIRVQRSRGCLSGCTYCIEGQANRCHPAELSWDGLDVEVFIERLHVLKAKGYYFINIIDSSFEDPGRRGVRDMLGFCREVHAQRLELSFKIHLRAETMLKLTPGDLATMKRAGVDVIIIGIESGDANELLQYQKIATKQEMLTATRFLKEHGEFCEILGHMMFSPFVNKNVLREKIDFLRTIGSGWDILNVTNKVLVFWGTKLHRQLEQMDLVPKGVDPLVGYVPYEISDPDAARMEAHLDTMKRRRPGFISLNKMIYDAMNLESRMLNPVNAAYLEMCGDQFSQFQGDLEERRSRLNATYCEGFERLIDDPDAEFLREFDPDLEAQRQRSEIETCLSFAKSLAEPPTTLYLHTWLSVINSQGAKFSKANSPQLEIHSSV